MPASIVGYAPGNCTWYVASRFPNMSPWLGNALTWLTNAKKYGYPTSPTPLAGSVVVYSPGGLYSTLGHVAVVDSVNADSTFNVTEMNYSGWNVISNRRSSMSHVLGFFIPPGSPAVLTASTNPITSALSVKPGSCITGSTSILGATICYDGVVGMLAIAAGGLLMLGGVAIFIAFALRGPIANKAADTLSIAGGPATMALNIARKSASKPKPSESKPDAATEKKASDDRMARAKERVRSPAAEEAISEAKAGRGTKLSSEVREELKGEQAA